MSFSEIIKQPIYTSDTRDIKICGVCIDRM